jgi:NAD(P)-dependent dehydrogenase (short-subunit alcohol dehydrogenase family)
MQSDRRLAGKRVLVTGAGAGIGVGIARQCAQAGAAVLVHYAHSDAGAREAVARIRSSGGTAEACGADLRDLSAVAALADRACEVLGGVDVVVNNAGITLNAPFDAVTPEQFDTLYQVNVRGGFFLVQRLLPVLEASGGSVVNITSVHAYQGMQEHSVYAGTKGALVAQTRAWAVELAPRGIRVNAIAPGCVPVPNYDKAAPGFDAAAMGRQIPVGYVGSVDDIGRAVVFLASEDGRFIVGQTLVIDGGTTSWLAFGEQFRQPLRSAGVQFGRGYVPGIE